MHWHEIRAIPCTAYQMAHSALPALIIAIALISGCTALEAPRRDSAVLQERIARDPVPADAPAWPVDPQASEIRLRVYRDGPLARFGHNHVITGTVHGEIRAGNTTAASGFRLEIPVKEFEVDKPEARAAEGELFAARISDQARRATRDNLLGPALLDADSHPLIVVESLEVRGARHHPDVTARVTLRGETRDLRFPAEVIEHNDKLIVKAAFRIRQSDFGIEPFSIMGGGLRVADAIDIHLRLTASPVS